MDKDDESIVINNRRKKDQGGVNKNTQAQGKESIKINKEKEEGKNKQVFQELINDSEFDNCNVNLKQNNSNKVNRPSSNIRKRSAFKYIEDNLEKEKEKDKENLKDKEKEKDKILEGGNNNNKNNNNEINPNQTNQGFLKDNNNINPNNKNKIDSNKPKIISENNMNKFLQNINGIEGNNTEKKIEYESRRKKPMSFINGIEAFSGASDKNNKGITKNTNTIKQEISGSGYESRRQNNNFHKNIATKEKDKDNENKFACNKNLSKI